MYCVDIGDITSNQSDTTWLQFFSYVDTCKNPQKALLSHSATSAGEHIDGLMQERRNSSALALELRPCINTLIYQKSYLGITLCRK